MTLGLLGRKKGMTQIFEEDGTIVPVTVLEVGPCTVIQRKEKKNDGYEALQLGFETAKPNRVSKPLKGHFGKKKVGFFRNLKEFRFASVNDFEVGQILSVIGFQTGDTVDVQGITKGRGFQGVMKKEGKHGGPDAHGSGFHRRPGSIGMRTWPGKVLKNMGMPGRMGGEKVMTTHLKVALVKPEENLLLLRGAVPGAREGLVIIYNKEKDFAGRYKQPEKKSEEVSSQG
ncbi:MAG: 50S ribosomal protein L3 [Deltaproteobacteria bacterium RIFCSPLOWO2_01_44_7]|nr:MAG: 50S ribosomal protein L3 [Deltaproteobacteria bacterium RIFCSPHIGHO2_01_FULL_43_49]OGQ14969.1 MAG: 50S ribosomal protein L3 [Deltaproteobacteria bacterium RIFCSPHIGHO2_02_FULL_44_53]OGQ29528.1 MAG: 50S ribosomal protein L3 [Deltaproteobacteria bacterium RIFCSPHIGHO2_12_FULL_44_21]OGQ31081.1 MAG: 50S ribosomal protein L3 [Deltaproteobacteria bacterium RIFCSPLOWO2_01_FULL_45_74]OGQ38666.1 MAG: 50S ribosomal protein L3 [Deltaproteobacteria bacterium RIFCSPLOWO2_01_44_7]OGQ42683.1 MAG: 50S